VAVGVAIPGPMAGEYAVIVLASLAGALWALSRVPAVSRVGAALLIARLVLTAVVLTSAAAWWLEQRYAVPLQQLLAPVAFAIGAFGDRWPALLGELWDRIIQRVAGLK